MRRFASSSPTAPLASGPRKVNAPGSASRGNAPHAITSASYSYSAPAAVRTRPAPGSTSASEARSNPTPQAWARSASSSAWTRPSPNGSRTANGRYQNSVSGAINWICTRSSASARRASVASSAATPPPAIRTRNASLAAIGPASRAGSRPPSGRPPISLAENPQCASAGSAAQHAECAGCERWQPARDRVFTSRLGMCRAGTGELASVAPRNSAGDEHRAGRGVQDAVGHAAEQEPLQRAPAVRAEDDQDRARLAGRGADLLDRIALPKLGRRSDASLPNELDRVLQDASGVLTL